MTDKDLSKFKEYHIGGWTFYVEITEDGRKILRHVKIFSNKYTFEIPSEGVTFDVVPANAVGSEQIRDKGIHEEDLDDDIVDKLNALGDAEEVPEDEIEDMWSEAMRNAGLDFGGSGH